MSFKLPAIPMAVSQRSSFLASESTTHFQLLFSRICSLLSYVMLVMLCYVMLCYVMLRYVLQGWSILPNMVFALGIYSISEMLSSCFV
jgi:hypothetical protein